MEPRSTTRSLDKRTPSGLRIAVRKQTIFMHYNDFDVPLAIAREGGISRNPSPVLERSGRSRTTEAELR